jgi:hypothetical protein
VLDQYFVGKYFTELQANGQPLIDYAIVPHTQSNSTLEVKDLNLDVSPFVGQNHQAISRPDSTQAGLATLNYLCATIKPPVPTAVPFG